MIGTADFAKVAQRMDDGDEKVKLVFDMFVDQIMGYVGNYFVKPGGMVDVLTFSGGIREGSEDLRAAMVNKGACLGFKLDDTLKNTSGSGAVTRLGPNVLLVNKNEEVSVDLTPCEGLLCLTGVSFSFSSRWCRSAQGHSITRCALVIVWVRATYI